MSRWKRLLVGLGIATLLCGFYASFFGVQTFLTLKARYIAWKQTAMNKIPVELTDLSISQADGKKLSYCGYEFEVPWQDIDEAKTRIVSGNKAIVTFRSGNVLLSAASAGP
jgi:hypothetical protein